MRRKLSESQVALVKQRLAAGERGIDLAAEYQVTKVCISLIQSGKRRAVPRIAKPPKFMPYGVYMIIRDETKQLPSEWTDQACYELVMHAMDLGHHGNPAGFLLLGSLHQFIGYNVGENKYLKINSEWDYEGMRDWLAQNSERVLNVWRYQVQTL